MSRPDASKSVVVGIDGSPEAVNAAVWAVDEASSRDVPLRLVHVVGVQWPTAHLPAEAVELGESALLEAQTAVQGQDRPVEVETVVLGGDLVDALIEESRHAAMICVGLESGQGPRRTRPGDIGVALARRAHCPVAIIRSYRGEPPIDSGWITVMLNDQPDNDAVVHQAMLEARLRGAPVLQIDGRADSWTRRYPDVPVYTMSVHRDTLPSHESHYGTAQLVVVSSDDAEAATSPGGTAWHPLISPGECSLLVVRG